MSKRLAWIGSESAYPLAMASSCIARCQVSVVQQVDASIVGSTRRLLMPVLQPAYSRRGPLPARAIGILAEGLDEQSNVLIRSAIS